MSSQRTLGILGWLLSVSVMLAAGQPATSAGSSQGSNPQFAPYLKPGELPDGATLPLMHEIWTIMGVDLNSSSFRNEVDKIAYNFWNHTEATGIDVGQAVPTLLDGELGKTAKTPDSNAPICCQYQ